MRRIFISFRNFIENHTKLTVVILLSFLITSCVMIKYSTFPIIPAITMFLTLITLSNIQRFKIGHIPLFMIDQTRAFYFSVHKCRRKYSKDELENRFREWSAKTAAVHFILSTVFFTILCVFELCFALCFSITL